MTTRSPRPERPEPSASRRRPASIVGDPNGTVKSSPARRPRRRRAKIRVLTLPPAPTLPSVPTAPAFPNPFAPLGAVPSARVAAVQLSDSFRGESR